MKILSLQIAILLCLLIGCNFQSQDTPRPKAVNGGMDLSHWDFEKDGVLSLNGDWEFYWEQFLNPGEVKTPDLIHVPGLWNGYQTSTGTVLEGDGYATYRLRLLTDHALQGLSLRLVTIQSAYQIDLNGKRITEAGLIGKTPGYSFPEYKVHTIRVPEIPAKQNELILRVSNFHQRTGGIFSSIQLGTDSEIQRIREKNISRELFLAGCLLIMGIYHLVLYSSRRKDRSALWFGIFCLLFSFRTIDTGEYYFYELFPFSSYETGVRLEYLSLYFAVPSFLLFFKAVFPLDYSRLIFRIIEFGCYSLSIVVLLFPLKIYAITLIPFEVFALGGVSYIIRVSIRTIINKREGAKSFLTGFIVLALTAVNDVLFTNEIIYTGYFLSLGLFFLIFSQSYILAKRFAGSFSELEDLSEHLEEKVKDRTKELESEKQKSVLRMNEFEKHNEALSKLTKSKAISSGNLNTAQNEFTEVAARILDVERASIWKYDNKNKSIVCVDLFEREKGIHSSGVEFFEKDYPAYFEYIKEERILSADNAHTNPATSEFSAPYLKPLNIFSIMDVPIWSEGSVAGVLCLEHTGSYRNWTTEEENFASSISGLVSTTIEADEKRKAKEETEYANVLTTLMIESPSLNDSLDWIFDHIMEKYPIDVLVLYFIDIPTGNIIPYKVRDKNIPDEKSEIIRNTVSNLNESDSLFAIALNRKKNTYNPKVIFDRTPNPSDRKFSKSLDLKSLLYIPIRVGQETLGMFAIYNLNEYLKLSKIQLNSITKLSSQIAGAIQKGKNLQEIEKAKLEIEKINEIIKKINSESELNSILKYIFRYLEDEFGIDGSIVMLKDEERNILYTINTSSPNVDQGMVEFSRNIRLPIDEKKSGLIARVFQKGKVFYIPRLEYENLPDDPTSNILKSLKLKSFLLVPLVKQNASYGMILLTSYSRKSKLSKAEIKSIESFCEHINGAIYNSRLLKQTEEAKLHGDIERGVALVAQRESELAKKEIEKLNSITKKINSVSSLTDVMTFIMYYLEKEFGFTDFWLLLKDDSNNHLKTFSYVSPGISSDRAEYFKDLKVSLDEESFLSSTFKNHKIQYTPVLENASLPALDQEIVRNGSLSFLLQIPFVIYEETIGILCLHNKSNGAIPEEILEKLFSFSNQVAGAIYNSKLFKQAQDLKEEAEEAKKKAEKQKEETENLNGLLKSLNQDLDLKVIMKKVHDYIKINFGIKYYGLAVVEKKSNRVMTIDAKSPDFLSAEAKNFILHSSAEFNTELGGHSFAFKTKKPFYIRNIERAKSAVTPDELFLLDTTGLESLLILPLILQNEPIGFLDLYNVEKMDLSKEDITKFSILAEQLAGIIYGSKLFLQVQEEKKIADEAKDIADKERGIALLAQKETEKQKEETENLNKLLKSLNEDLDIKIIMKKVHSYIKSNFEINFYGLGVIDKTGEIVRAVDAQMPDFVSPENRDRVNRFETKVKIKKGGHALAFRYKRPFYISKITEKMQTPEEMFLYRTLKFESLLIMPLILENEPIGFLDLYNVGKMELSKEDITKFSILSEQLAGIVHGSNLFKEVQEEKEKATVAREEAEKAKREVEELNSFLKNINEKQNIPEVLAEVKKYMRDVYRIEYFYLWLYNQKENSIFYHSGIYPSEEQRINFMKNGHTKISFEKKGIHSQASKRKTYTHLANIRNRSVGNEQEDKNQEIIKMSSLLFIPLYVQDTFIGMLDFSHIQEKINLTKTNMERIYIFCQQVAGIIQNFSLMEEVKIERDKSENLLLNILPKDVAKELKEKGFAEPVLYESVTVLFTDFKGFTQIAETLTPTELLKDLDACFVQFDKITERYSLEKLKTIGDSYMCAGGIPRINTTHPVDSCLAALEIQAFMNLMKKLKEEKGFPYWELRLGIHTGPLVAGVIGEKKFAYDVWGDTVNTASRMESSGTTGRINISSGTYEFVNEFFDCDYRGEVAAKNKGVVKMYYLNRLKPEYSKDEVGHLPNREFWKAYSKAEPKS